MTEVVLMTKTEDAHGIKYILRIMITIQFCLSVAKWEDQKPYLSHASFPYVVIVDNWSYSWITTFFE